MCKRRKALPGSMSDLFGPSQSIIRVCTSHHENERAQKNDKSKRKRTIIALVTQAVIIARNYSRASFCGIVSLFTRTVIEDARG